MLKYSPFNKWDAPLGQEKPGDVFVEIAKLLGDGQAVFNQVYKLSGYASGLVAAFVLFMYIWRPFLITRLTLLIMFVVSVMDCAATYVHLHKSDGTIVSAWCRGYHLYVDFSMYFSVYLSSSIAANLHMVFLRTSKQPLSVCVRFWYLLVPLALGMLHFWPQHYWAATHHICSPLDPIFVAARHYATYFVFVFLYQPWLFVIFNAYTCWKIFGLFYSNQKHTDCSLPYTSEQSNESDMAATKEYACKTNNTALHTALYPLVPAVYCIMMSIHNLTLANTTFTYKSDVPAMVTATQMAWYAYPATNIVRLCVFFTDPITLDVIREVRVSLAAKFSKKAQTF